MNAHAKRYAVFFLTVLALALMQAEVDAASVQVRAGGGSLLIDNGGSLSQAGVDLFYYEGRRVELFVGAELAKAEDVSTNRSFNGGFDASIPYSLNITAATFGLRLKPALSGIWRPYLSLGGIAGRADYEVDASGLTSAVLLSTGSGSANFVSPRLGLGMEMGLGEQWSLGLELTYTGSAPVFNTVVADYNTGRIEDVKVNNKADMGSAALGLRYAF